MRLMVLYIVIAPIICFSQVSDFETDYTLAKGVFADKEVWLEADYKLFANHSDDILVSRAHSETYISQEVYNQSIEGVHSIIEWDQVLICDSNEEHIVLDTYEGDILRAVFSIDIDQLSNFITEVEDISDNSSIIYRLHVENSEVQLLELRMNRVNHHFEKIVLYYAYSESLGDDMADVDTPRLEITLKPYKFNGSKKWTIRNNPFVKWSNNKVVIEKPYKDYNFINNMSGQ